MTQSAQIIAFLRRTGNAPATVAAIARGTGLSAAAVRSVLYCRAHVYDFDRAGEVPNGMKGRGRRPVPAWRLAEATGGPT